MKKWSLNSWKNFEKKQQPQWHDLEIKERILNELSSLPALVFSGETRNLKKDLIAVDKGDKFILQAGNCAETFSDCRGSTIHNYLRIMLQMSMVLETISEKEIVKIGRIAGQYAKPRSSNYEIVNGNRIPSYRGDIVNCITPTKEARVHNPEKLLEGYFRSAATLNLIRAFIQGGYSDIANIFDWKHHFFDQETSSLSNYKDLEQKITKSLSVNLKQKSATKANNFFTSHECLLLDYEKAFTRIDTTHGGYYDTSGHFLWIGDRTRNIESAHIEFVRGIGNPIGIKIGPKYESHEIVEIVKKINPENEKGKIVLIIRLGSKNIKYKFPPLINAIKDSNLNVIWMIDPMHGNTFTYGKFKVRDFDVIVKEIEYFFDICKNEKIIPGGIHLEITADNVTECIGGVTGLDLNNIDKNYVTKVDPRLNAAQALELSFIVGNFVKSIGGINE